MSKAQSSCLSSDDFDHLLRDDVDDVTAESYWAHLAQCDRCRRAFEDYSGSDTLEDDLRDALESAQSLTTSLATMDHDETHSITPPDIPGYDIVNDPRRGGQGVVFQARQRSTNRTVAIKMLLHGHYATIRQRQRFDREIAVVARLGHPNIVTIYDSGQAEDGRYYYVMEYIDGQSVHEYVDTHQLSLRDVCVLCEKICAAVTCAHQSGVIHRDIKPGNILVDRRGEPRVVDFGLAMLTDDQQLLSRDTSYEQRSGIPAGTLAYMSPEQVTGLSDTLDVRTDVYSLGVLLYRLFTGQAPYPEQSSLADAVDHIRHHDPPAASRVRRDIDDDLSTIIATAMAKKPDMRYQSAQELAHDLRAWLSGEPISVKSHSSLYLLRNIAGRHRFAAAVIILLMTILLTFGYAGLHLYFQAGKDRQRAEISTQQLGQTLTQMHRMARWFAFWQLSQEWLEDEQASGAKARRFMAREEGTREAAAVHYLYDEGRWEDKTRTLLDATGEQDRAFVSYVVALRHLNENNIDAAVTHLRQALTTLDELLDTSHESRQLWLRREVVSTLREYEQVYDRLSPASLTPTGADSQR